ncbi:MAG: hypothetical protein CMH61_02315 [Nanoarchaeota archaeon]|nr:hypothetical protein [Nanoarchaeota archaeon]
MHKKKKKDADEKVELFPSEEQGILNEQTTEEIKDSMEHGDIEEDVYTAEGREQLEEDDEISNVEQGFMEGASGAGQLGVDALTGEPLMDIEDVVETQIDGKKYRFVNQENARKFREKKSQE